MTEHAPEPKPTKTRTGRAIDFYADKIQWPMLYVIMGHTLATLPEDIQRLISETQAETIAACVSQVDATPSVCSNPEACSDDEEAKRVGKIVECVLEKKSKK